MEDLYNDLICFSHLRWNFVFQRPQHLMTRFAKQHRVFFIEEPVYDATEDYFELTKNGERLWVIVMHLQNDLAPDELLRRKQKLLHTLLEEVGLVRYVVWYYSPMALEIGRHLQPVLTVYDCMDELSAFKFAPMELKIKELELMTKADVVFTGGTTLFKAKKHQHNNIHPFPSSIDKEHFYKARNIGEEPIDQQIIAHPRLGYYGVIDERINLSLIEEMADIRPDWQFVFIGPVVKIDPASLPQRSNIHYLGMKTYDQLPGYLAGWDICLMPFALNESTKFISPTKTPEYLAGGKPVISTSIKDVIEPYGSLGLVHIADTAAEFIHAASIELESENKGDWLKKADDFLKDISWDKTWSQMDMLMQKTLNQQPVQA
jgi:glycosyltransferase involved in cell wall biosynthesis